MHMLTHNRFLVVLTSMALITGGLRLGHDWIQPAQAQTGGIWKTTNFLTTDPVLIGIGRGQKFRVSIGTDADSPGETITFTVTITSNSGVVLFHSDPITVSPLRFRWLQVSSTQLATEGDTLRTQVLIQVNVSGVVDGSKVVGALEVVDETTDRTEVYHPFGDFLLHNSVRDSSVLGTATK
jgi:hypothetical protein